MSFFRTTKQSSSNKAITVLSTIALLLSISIVVFYQPHQLTSTINSIITKTSSTATATLGSVSSINKASETQLNNHHHNHKIPSQLLQPNIMTKSSMFKFIPRLSASRGYANHGWLQSYHSFSFASYYDPSHTHYGPLRVINEDNIGPDEGFDKHPHSSYEIFSYVLSGELTHKDSMGNTEVMRRGDIQHTRAGTGITHSEQNLHKTKDASLLQIWVKPDVTRLPPKYFTRHHDDNSKRGLLKHIVAPIASFAKEANIPEQDGKDELIPIQTDLNFFASLLPSGQSVSHQFMKAANADSADPKRTRLGYLHLVMSSGIRSPKTAAPVDGAKLKVTAEDGTEIELTEGDAVKIEAKELGSITIESTGGKEAEFVFFDMKTE